MSLKRQVTSRSEESKEQRYVVKQKSKYLKDGEPAPSFFMYIKSYILVPIILTVLLACFRDGWIFIILMWSLFLLKHIYTYEKMYPQARPATEKEIRLYTLSKKKELLDLDKKYKSRLVYYDVYGKPKRINEEYSKEIAFRLENRKQINPKFDMFDNADRIAKEKEMSLRSEMETELSKADEIYGSNWREDFRKELIENGFIRD